MKFDPECRRKFQERKQKVKERRKRSKGRVGHFWWGGECGTKL